MTERQQRLLTEGVMEELQKAKSNNSDPLIVQFHLELAITTLSAILEEESRNSKENREG